MQKNISSVSLYPFEDGQLPLVINGTGQVIQILRKLKKAALTLLSQNQIPYTLAITGDKNYSCYQSAGYSSCGIFQCVL